MTKTSAAVKNRWNDKTYDYFKLVMPKGYKTVLKALAEAEGKSLNKYIMDKIKGGD